MGHLEPEERLREDSAAGSRAAQQWRFSRRRLGGLALVCERVFVSPSCLRAMGGQGTTCDAGARVVPLGHVLRVGTKILLSSFCVPFIGCRRASAVSDQQ